MALVDDFPLKGVTVEYDLSGTVAMIYPTNDPSRFAVIELTGRTFESVDVYVEGYQIGAALDEEVIGETHPGARPSWLSAEIVSQVTRSGQKCMVVLVTADEANIDPDTEAVVLGIRVNNGLSTFRNHFWYWPFEASGSVPGPDELTYTRFLNEASRKEEPGMAVADGDLYIFGGRGYTNTNNNDVQVFNPATEDWDPVVPGTSAGNSAALVCVVGTVIYFAAGFRMSGGFSVASVLVKSLDVTNVGAGWASLPDFPFETGTRGMAQVQVGDLLYFFGRQADTDSAHVWDPVAQTVTQLADMPVARLGAVAVHKDGKIYVGPGSGGESTLLIYDIALDSWTTQAVSWDRPGRVDYAGGLLYDTYFVIVGGDDIAGSNATERYSDIEVLDLRDFSLPAVSVSLGLDEVMSGQGCCVFGDELFVVGGSDGGVDGSGSGSGNIQGNAGKVWVSE